MKKTIYVALLCALSFFVFQSESCDYQPSADQVEKVKQEKMQEQAIAETGMPSIVNYTEKKRMRENYERRDDPNLICYAYLYAENSGKLVFFGKCKGYGIPYAAQFSNPEKWVNNAQEYSHLLPQAEPNGVFSPASADGTWLLMINPNDPTKTESVYVEPKVVVSPFPITIAQ
jgi:hypothetical protein